MSRAYKRKELRGPKGRRFQSNFDRDIHTVDDGYASLICAVKEQAIIDKSYFDCGMPPPGNCGYSRNKKGEKTYDNLLTYDPIEEWEESEAKEILDCVVGMIDKHRRPGKTNYLYGGIK